MKKHIVIFNHNAGSVHHGPNFRSYYSALGWLKLGYQVTIVCSSFSHKLSKLPLLTEDHLFEDVDGLRYLWLKTTPYKSNLGRLRNYYQYRKQLNRVYALIEENVDLVLCSSPPPLWIWFCEKYAQHKEAKLIFEARDLWPDVIYETSRTGKFNPVAWYMRLAERKAYACADKVVSVNALAIEVMKKRGLEEARFIAISNGVAEPSNETVDTSEYDWSKRLDDVRSKADLIVGYGGALSKVYGLETLINAAEQLGDAGIHFVLAGTGPYQAVLNEILLKIKDMPYEERDSIGHAGFEYVLKNHTYEALNNKWDELFKSLIEDDDNV